MQYSVRPSAVEDAAGIAAVHVAAWQAAYRGLLPDDLLDNLSVPARQARWSAILADPRPRTMTLVAATGETILGFASVGARRCADAQDDDGELYAIYLHPDQWRRGIGSRLHGAALSCLADLGFTTVTVWVLVGNERAISFYHRAGWHDDGVTRVDTGPSGVELPEIRLRRRLAPGGGGDPRSGPQE